MSEPPDSPPNRACSTYQNPPVDSPEATESIFLETATEVADSPILQISEERTLARIGPGFFESLAWMFGFYVVQIVAVVFACVLLVLSFMTSAGAGTGPSSDPNMMSSINSVTAYLGPHLMHIFGFAQLSTVLYSMMAVRLRLGSGGLRELGWHLPWKGHAVLIVALCLPLSFLCTAFQTGLFAVFPASRGELEEMMKLFGQAPLSLLVLVVGLGPALGEELLFRGLIGRGLIRRCGLPAGVAITSVLFGLWHLLPAQAIAVIPLGLAMHFVYCATRSFWAPIALHFLNNALAMVILKYSSHPLIEKYGNSAAWHSGGNVPLLVASAATVSAILILLWQTRVHFVLKDGSVWDPGYATTVAPPAELEAVPLHQEPRALMLAGSAFNSLGFAAGVWRLTDWAGLPW